MRAALYARAAIYARVSTLDQEPENQLAELRQYVSARGWTTAEYVDAGVSGSKERRPALDRLVADARRRKLDTVVVWRLDPAEGGLDLVGTERGAGLQWHRLDRSDSVGRHPRQPLLRPVQDDGDARRDPPFGSSRALDHQKALTVPRNVIRATETVRVVVVHVKQRLRGTRNEAGPSE